MLLLAISMRDMGYLFSIRMSRVMRLWTNDLSLYFVCFFFFPLLPFFRSIVSARLKLVPTTVWSHVLDGGLGCLTYDGMFELYFPLFVWCLGMNLEKSFQYWGFLCAWINLSKFVPAPFSFVDTSSYCAWPQRLREG